MLGPSTETEMGPFHRRPFPCRRNLGCEPCALDRIQGDADDLVREIDGLSPALRSKSNSIIGTEQYEWKQWPEPKKPVDWRPHTSIAVCTPGSLKATRS